MKRRVRVKNAKLEEPDQTSIINNHLECISLSVERISIILQAHSSPLIQSPASISWTLICTYLLWGNNILFWTELLRQVLTVVTNARVKMSKGPFRENHRTAQGHSQKLFDITSEKYKITLFELSNRYFFPSWKAAWVQNVASTCQSKKVKLWDHC